jgi:hypothetical protein
VSAVDLPLARRTTRPSALRRLLEEECFVVLVVAVFLAAVARMLAGLVVQDTWLALVDGRWIAQHGLPHVDRMAVWTNGVRWIDQQWLAHLALYGLVRAGGMRLLLAVGLGLAFLALGLAAYAARRAGGSARSTALLVPVAIFCAPWLLQVRTQSFALPLFVAVYALLAADSRRPSRRVFLVLPLLVLWGNLHGSVALGAGLVAVHGVLAWRRRALLALLAPATLVVSPYGLHLVGYYKWMLVGSPLGDYVEEWKPATPSGITAVFFLVAFAAVFVLARHARAVSRFERAALPLLVLGGLLAVRNGVWLGLACAVSAPLILDAEWRPAIELTPPLRRLNAAMSSVAIAISTLIVAVTLAKPAASFERGWRSDGAAAAATAAGPAGRVLADDRHSDWLLWEHPELAGRLAYDVRFELFGRSRLAALQAFRNRGGPTALADGYRVLTFASLRDARRFGGRIVYRSAGFVVVRQ